ncbi:MAG: protein kinase, partial [Pirellulales bacterium]|nr:protein kinase [Pirellulales bacterium]
MSQPQSNPDSQRPARGLLGAILSDPVLRQRLGQMPADEKTIAVSSDGAGEFSHPDWETPNNADSANLETLEVSHDTAASPCGGQDSGFVPLRRVATLGGGKDDQAEYRLVGRLGSGGTGIVYQAHQRAIDREVAIKALRLDLADQLSRDRFLAEARVIGGLDHPNVIALHEVCVDQSGGLFYSMKRIDGTSWDQQIGEKTERENLDTLLRVADAIRYAHSRRLIHRDIKPENVMLGKFGEVLLADWGLALNYGTRETACGSKHSIGGTPAYMAPELASGDHTSISFQTDVYLLGAILFQILTGHPPHDGPNLLACIHAAANNEIRPTTIEGELMDIAIKAMATGPQDRFASVQELIEAINNHRQHQQSGRLVERAHQRLAVATADNHYEDFRIVDALLMEALETWPGNKRALESRAKLQAKFAAAATAQGDLDLAISLYQAAGQSDSQAAQEVRRAREHRENEHHRASRYSALFTQSPEAGLLIQLSSGKVMEANEMFGELFGYSAEALVDREIKDLNLWAGPS